MKVTFQREGGEFLIPSLNRPVTLDTSTLSPKEASELERLVSTSHFFDQPATVGTFPPGAVGFFQYDITIEDGGHSHTVQLNDFTEPPELMALRDFLQERARH